MIVELLEDGVIDFGVVIRQLKIAENIFSFLSHAVVEHGDLAFLRLAGEIRSGAEALKSLLLR
jgi:hypothetical protein